MMREIQMVDLKSQYEKIGSEIDQALKSVIASSAFIKGPEVKLFEEELQNYLGVANVISCANGTDALQIALMALDLKPGDEIITTDFTFIATAEVVALLGLKLVFADAEEETFNISADSVRKALSPRTRVIVPVHLFGQCSDMDEISKIAAENNIYIIEDAAQATGADFISAGGIKRKAGTIGHIGTTSFFPSKNLGCYGDGGAIYTFNDALAEKIRSIANHGMKTRYYHDHIGVNSRLDTIQAAILRVKLKYLDEFNESRRKVADFYDEAFLGTAAIKIPGRTAFSTHIFHQYTLKIAGGLRDKLKVHLQSLKIPSMIYYPVPLHLQNAYKYLGYKPGDFPVTEKLCNEVISLPMCPDLDQEQLDYITTGVLSFFENR
jgi:UDP-2-acetamido-2-deoxy-ribo-hexuluronate aminotransferase